MCHESAQFQGYLCLSSNDAASRHHIRKGYGPRFVDALVMLFQAELTKAYVYAVSLSSLPSTFCSQYFYKLDHFRSSVSIVQPSDLILDILKFFQPNPKPLRYQQIVFNRKMAEDSLPWDQRPGYLAAIATEVAPGGLTAYRKMNRIPCPA